MTTAIIEDNAGVLHVLQLQNYGRVTEYLWEGTPALDDICGMAMLTNPDELDIDPDLTIEEGQIIYDSSESTVIAEYDSGEASIHVDNFGSAAHRAFGTQPA